MSQTFTFEYLLSLKEMQMISPVQVQSCYLTTY